MYLWCQCHVLTTYQIYCRVADFIANHFLQLLSSFLLFVECDSIHCHLVKSYLLKHIRMLLLMREQCLDFWAGQCLCLFTDTPGGVIWKLLSHQLTFTPHAIFILWCKYNFRWKCEWLQRSMYWLANFNLHGLFNPIHLCNCEYLQI